ncbi:MAG TPA: ABC transporter, partial [Actinomycetota bacterium]|nr:ABC transporter [Actinomycetota bacterium]
AATLSGGEQQMLGLSKALMLEPRLLLIDELSLGLAPVIVQQLLKMVRRINEQGTAVVLVEQSVNIALNLVEHAYFMEKGEIRFDGKARDLLRRDDLLRAVFLQGTRA